MITAGFSPVPCEESGEDAEAPLVCDALVLPPPVVQALISSASTDAPRAILRYGRIGSSLFFFLSAPDALRRSGARQPSRVYSARTRAPSGPHGREPEPCSEGPRRSSRPGTTRALE